MFSLKKGAIPSLFNQILSCSDGTQYEPPTHSARRELFTAEVITENILILYFYYITYVLIFLGSQNS